MTHHVVLSAIGPDRPGLVDEVAQFVADRRGNVADSRMINLHGQFAMMMLVEGTDDDVARLKADVATLSAASHVHAEVIDAEVAATPAPVALPFKLETWAMDHPGLLQSISHLLRESGVNIESATTSLKEAPMTGAPVFSIEAVLAVPADASIAQLRESLGHRCDDLNMDWRLTAL